MIKVMDRNELDISTHDAILLFLEYSALFVLGFFGIVFNLLSIVIWTRPQLKSRTAILLTALGFSDAISIISLYPKLYLELYGSYHLLFSGTKSRAHLLIFFVANSHHIVKWVYPVFCIAQTMSTYMTLAITVERFIAVCYPLQYQAICSYSRTLKTTVAITLFAIVYNLPRFWFELLQWFGTRTSHEFGYRDDPLQQFYLIWLELFIDYLLPLAAIIICNTTVCIKLKMASRRRDGMTSQQDLTALQKRENRLTTMLIYVVFEFIICFSINGFMSIQNAFHYLETDILIIESTQLFSLQEKLRPMGIFFTLFNASANFLSYVTFGQPFRTTLKETLCCCCHQQVRDPECPRNQGLNLDNVEIGNPNRVSPFVTASDHLIHRPTPSK